MPTRALVSIIEDDQIVSAALVDLVQSLGFSAAAFPSAEEYLLAGLFPVTSCLIVDLRLPGMSGADLQDNMIAEGGRIPIIFVTAVCNDMMRARLLKRGAIGVLGKPFDESLLIECLHEAIRHL